MKDATLVLSDGSTFRGKSFGYEAPVTGEVVFNTAMTGYPESLTDPSYAGQIMVLTYPLVGNYGVPSADSDAQSGLPLFMESERIHARALVVADYSDHYSHWNARESLAEWLRREHVPAITGIDTRALTQLLREQGVMMGRIAIGAAANGQAAANGNDPGSTSGEGQASLGDADYGSINWVERVSCKDVITYTPSQGQLAALSASQARGVGKRVVLVDCGVKANILRCLLRRGVEVIRVPWNYDYTAMTFDGLFLANGPGDPDCCVATVEILKRQMALSRKPICGICMGNQLLAKAAGARTYKLKYGHRSHNQPVREVGTNRCYITSQNHGYAVDASTLPADWRELFVNMNDGSNEGIRHQSNPWFSSQFHPEACAGPTDTEFMFDRFIDVL